MREHLIIAAVAAILFTIYFIEIAKIPYKVAVWKWFPLNRKPFTCQFCLPVWLTLLFLLLSNNVLILISCCAAAGIITPLLINFIRRC